VLSSIKLFLFLLEFLLPTCSLLDVLIKRYPNEKMAAERCNNRSTFLGKSEVLQLGVLMDWIISDFICDLIQAMKIIRSVSVSGDDLIYI
jgi:hypothetical protein